MARNTRIFKEQTMDQTSNFVNIDTLIDVLTTAQLAEGVEPTFQLAKLDNEGNKTHEVEEVKKLTCHTCNKCTKETQEKSKLNRYDFGNLFIPFGQSVDDDHDDDEDDGPSICTYCDSLGYSEKYQPDVCDRCSNCDGCPEYKETCDGCEFSIYWDGRYYRDKLPESEIMDQNDIDNLNDIDDLPDTILESKGFSVSRI